MRVLVVDDSTVFRKVVRDALSTCSSTEVIGVAGDGRAALGKIKQLKPDLVTLDVEMPVMNGIELLRELEGFPDRPEVIMLSAITENGALATTTALKLGAFDFVLKPSLSSLEENCARLRQDLLPKIDALVHRAAKRQPTSRAVESEVQQSRPSDADIASWGPVKVVAIGVSTGGPAALTNVLPRLPGDLAAPLLIVQHMPPIFTRSLADDLNRLSQISVYEATEGQTIEPSCAYIAPGGCQMKVGKIKGRYVIRVTDDPPEKNCRPSVDYLFRSVAHTYASDALAVVMTGMGDDGALGCRLLKRNGGKVVAQDEASCVVYGMPRQVVDAGLADVVSPLSQLPDLIGKVGSRGGAACR